MAEKSDLIRTQCNILVHSFKGCVRYIFDSLFFKTKREHLRNKKNVFYFLSEALFVFEKIKC